MKTNKMTCNENSVWRKNERKAASDKFFSENLDH